MVSVPFSQTYHVQGQRESVALKGKPIPRLVHRKLRELIPILDNEAILGAYMNPIWPERRASIGHVYSPIRIR